MHLEGPWLSTTGKKRGKQKWVSAEAKKLAQQRQAEWDRKLLQFDKMAPKFKHWPIQCSTQNYVRLHAQNSART